jgi:hypothetical protein
MPYHKFSRVLLLLSLICYHSRAQSPNEKKKAQFAQLKSWIDSRKYLFQAQSATTQKGRTIQLTSTYTLKVNNDSLQVDLPYYGRAYTTQYPPTDLSLRFNSNQFSYLADTTKKCGWDITIDKPKNSSGVSKISMYITASGYCTMRVTSSQRDMISFYGTIAAPGDR